MAHIVALEDFSRIVSKVFPSQPGIGNGEKQYEECLGHREFWDDLEKISVRNVKEIVVPFLNKWQCRLPYDCAQGLTDALQSMESWLRPLRGFSIDMVDLNDSTKLKSDDRRIFMHIEDIFDVIRKVKAGRRSVAFTAASKILHMAIPEFFVMCDKSIRNRYGCEGNGAGYANFMFRMNFLAQDLILQADGQKKRILNCSRWKERTFARLIDNYNYVKYTLRKS